MLTVAATGGVLATTTALGLGGLLVAAATELQLASNRTDKGTDHVGHLVYLLTRMLFSAVGTTATLTLPNGTRHPLPLGARRITAVFCRRSKLHGLRSIIASLTMATTSLECVLAAMTTANRGRCGRGRGRRRRCGCGSK